MNQKSTLIAAVAVCSAAGFMVGRISSDPSDPAFDSANGAPNSGSAAQSRQERGGVIGPRAAGQSSARERRISSSSSSSLGAVERMQDIINNPNPLARAEEWLRFVKGLDSNEIEDVVVSFRSKGLASENLSEYAMLLTAWANYDPITALDYASKNTGSPFARQTILTTWATTDPAGAMRWAEENHKGEGANPWMVGVIRGIAASDPERATALMNAMPYSRERGEALSAVQGHYLKQGPEAARAWAMSIEDERLRAGAMIRVADKLALTDPKGTADWLLANPGEGTTRAISTVMERMAEADTDAAVAYFESIQDQNLKGSALEGVTDQLAAKDPQAALALMDANPSLVSDDVVTEFVWGARDKDPALAANTISRIQDAEERNRTYRRYMWRWMSNDMEAATNWANQTDLPEGVRRTVDSIAERMRNENQNER